VNEPRLVILDEPMSGLDPVGRRQVRRAILSLKERGLTVFFSSHILSDMEMICDRIGLLMGGKLSAAGTVDELVGNQEAQIEVAAENVSESCRKELSVKAQSVVDQGKVTYFVFENGSDAEEAVAKLMAQGAHLTLFRPARESLEEYFMRTTGQSRADIGAWSGGGDK
ncbi:MAG: ABC transporter ATP-binding protein, partial [Planctomycetes bacterium]|nr:ABC transporter ATP-binding protein [Planctomycetota bacterium]